MSRQLSRPYRPGHFPRLEVLEDRTAPALLTLSSLLAEVRVLVDRVVDSWHNDRASDSGIAFRATFGDQDQFHFEWTWSWKVDFNWQDIDAGSQASPPPSTPSSTGSTTATSTAPHAVSPMPDIDTGTATTISNIGTGSDKGGRSGTNTTTTGATPANTSPVQGPTVTPDRSITPSPVSDKGSGSTGTTTTAATPASTSAVQVTPATSERTSTTPVGYFLSISATSGASGSHSAEMTGEGSVLTKQDESVRATVRSADALSGGADGKVELDESSASLPANMDLPDAGNLPAPADVAASLVGAQPRADVLHQRGGGLSVVATAVAGTEPLASNDQEGNLRDDLFVGPLNASLATAALPLTDNSDQTDFAFSEEGGTGFNWMLHGIALTTVALAAATVWGMQRRGAREEEMTNLVRL
jgi:hypothetical protein